MLSGDGERQGLYAASVIVNETTVTQHQMWLLPSPARHGGCKTNATPAPLALSLSRGCRFSLFSARPCTPMLNFFARSGPKIEKIDSLWTGGGI